MASNSSELLKAIWDTVQETAKDFLTQENVKQYLSELTKDLADAKWTSLTAEDPEIRALAERRMAHRKAQLEAEVIRLGLEATKTARLLSILQSVLGIVIRMLPTILQIA